jgi:DNA-binding LacI/PurR family transcriptional regulator
MPKIRPKMGAKSSPVATMQDVAEASGLSRFTVSKVLNGTPGVSEKTRALVMKTCEKLSFVPNQHASSLAKGGARLMGMVVTSIVDPFYGEIIHAAEQTASSLGFDLAYRCSYGDGEQERRIVRTFLGLKAGALIVSGVSTGENVELWASLSQKLPVVFIDHPVLEAGHLVTTDHYAGARSATEHLLQRGVAPAYLGSAQPLTNRAILDRQRGYLDAMAKAKRPAVLIPTEPPSERSDNELFGYQAMAAFLKAPGCVTPNGLACATDAIALGAMKALAEHGLLPGRDVLVTGHDDLPFSAFLNPALTTVRQPKSWIGRQAVEGVASLLEVKNLRRAPAIRLVQAPELIVRQSTAGRGRA